MVPGAGSALTGGLALGVAGLDRGADGVFVSPRVISCGACAIGLLGAPGDCWATTPSDPTVTAAPTPMAINANFIETTCRRCRANTVSPRCSVNTLARNIFDAMTPDWHVADRSAFTRRKRCLWRHRRHRMAVHDFERCHHMLTASAQVDSLRKRRILAERREVRQSIRRSAFRRNGYTGA
jgi:hypothetical protein